MEKYYRDEFIIYLTHIWNIFMLLTSDVFLTSFKSILVQRLLIRPVFFSEVWFTALLKNFPPPCWIK